MAPLSDREILQSLRARQSHDYRDSIRRWDVLCQAICLSISTILVLLRLWTKFHIVRAPGWEDCTSVMSWLGMIAYSVISLEADKHGSGVHQSQVTPEDLIHYAQLANISQIIYGPLIFVAKLSILLLYLRAFTPSRPGRTFYAIHFLLWFNLLFYTANTLTKIFQCIPRAKIWDPETPGRCVNVNALIQTSAGLNVFSDFSLLVLPIAAIWKLHMKTSQKIGISAVFAAGLFGCISSIMRLVIGIEKQGTQDKTYDWFPEFLWTSAEITSAIITSCLPTLPNFFRHYFRKAMIPSRNSQHRTNSTNRHPYSRPHFNSTPHSHLGVPWYHRNPSDDDLLPHSYYMELDEAKPSLSPGAVVRTEIIAESRPESREYPPSISSVNAREEGERQCPSSRNGILKTVQVEIQTRDEERATS
ncbi:hypothetical protein DTO271G3_2158 [Paecilomyces variotii]|nr:hypothetical protein DTO271G3_2158 [Paecilomyces variotii]